MNPTCTGSVQPGVILVADCFAGLIWRIDLQGEPMARVWLKHPSMGYYPLKPEQPGVNGIHYAPRSQYLCYSAAANKLFMRVPVNPTTLEPAGEPEYVVAGRMGRRLLHRRRCVSHLPDHPSAEHPRHRLDDPGTNSGFTQSVAGRPKRRRKGR